MHLFLEHHRQVTIEMDNSNNDLMKVRQSIDTKAKRRNQFDFEIQFSFVLLFLSLVPLKHS